MRLAVVESILPASLPHALPIRLEQRPSGISIILKLLILLPVTLALATPFAMLGKALAADPAVRAAVMSRPAGMLQLGTALAFWVVLFAWPLKRLIEGLARSRVVEISDSDVTITDTTWLGMRAETVALSSYYGVIHHVRASLSGLRHELILAHPNLDNAVLVAIADRISQSEIDRLCALTGLPEVPSGIIYRLGLRRDLPATANPPLARAA